MNFLNRLAQLDFCGFFVQAVIASLFLGLLIRRGLVALIFCLLIRNLLSEFPVTADLSVWYAGTAMIAVACAVFVLVSSFYAALGGRSPITIRALES